MGGMVILPKGQQGRFFHEGVVSCTHCKAQCRFHYSTELRRAADSPAQLVPGDFPVMQVRDMQMAEGWGLDDKLKPLCPDHFEELPNEP